MSGAILSFVNQTLETRNAIAYYRHSAEDKQENSVPIQREHTVLFAKKHNITIIHEEADEGKTGLLADRPGFNRLFQRWILNEKAPSFEYVLVFDVSRWGRFQDQDEAAYYEFLCKKRGKKVVYVEKGFPREDQQLIAHLETSIQRYMAADYSRQLSNKVFYGCARISGEGYSAGGPPCFGMARLLLDVNKKPVRILKRGERKQIENERVIFIPANDETTKTVRQIFDLYVQQNTNTKKIAAILNDAYIPSARGCTWNDDKVLRVLKNEIYIGTRLYNKTSNRLKRGKRNNPKKEWIICKKAFPPTVDKEIFWRAQKKIRWSELQRDSNSHSIKKIRALVLQKVARVFENYGFIREEAINKAASFPILFSVTSRKGSRSQWCFMLSEKMWDYKFVLGIGIKPGCSWHITHHFVIPINDFGCSGTIIFSVNSERYKTYILKPDAAEIKLSELVVSEIKQPNRQVRVMQKA